MGVMRDNKGEILDFTAENYPTKITLKKIKA